MRWTTGGPDIPPELLRATEDGGLVWFCGAGVSYRAGLPGFKGLIEKVYEFCNVEMDSLESEEFGAGNHDRVLSLLENRIAKKGGAANFVRQAAMRALHLGPAPDLSTHAAILALSTSSSGTCRLVTTNFDEAFERVGHRDLVIDAAPKLPLPKRTWHGLVHLHGRISDTDPGGSTLVLTSADFGAAYLTEGWAARFITELFRRFTVLFAGYSFEDTVMRYMMDAFAADRALGEGVGKAYALVGVPATQGEREESRWRAKGVIPLLYDDSGNHEPLHASLSRWAERHREGLLGKEAIIVQSGSLRPCKPFDMDPTVSQVVWAVGEKDGHIAGCFARADPVPPIEWLDAFAEAGLLARPANDPSQPVPIADPGYRTRNPGPLNPVTARLADWLARHLDKPETLSWVLRSGGCLHPEFRSSIRRHLPSASLPSALCEIWWALCSPDAPDADIQELVELGQELEAGRWPLSVKHRLQAALTPVLRIGPSVLRGLYADAGPERLGMAWYAEVGVDPRCGNHITVLQSSIRTSPQRSKILQGLADDLTSHLKRALELFQVAGKADGRHDPGCFDMPSISSHPQNEHLRSWTVLIELLRDGFDELRGQLPDDARRLVERWQSITFPLFKRLSLYAMTVSDLYEPVRGVSILLEDDAWWLWSIYVGREKFRFLLTVWPRLSRSDADLLISSILAGPPRSMYRRDLGEPEFREIADREIWELLMKLQATGGWLPEAASRKLAAVAAEHPEWREIDERGEFAVWTSGGWVEPTVGRSDGFVGLPDVDVQGRLADPKSERPEVLREWQGLLASQSERSVVILGGLSEAGLWPPDVWKATIETLLDKRVVADHWDSLTELLAVAPDGLFGALAREIAWMLWQVSSELAVEADDRYFTIWDRCMPFAFDLASESIRDPVTTAINAPSGFMAESLLARALLRRPRAAGELGPEFWGRMSRIAAGDGRSFVLARVILASRLSWIHSLDADWAAQNLIPRFSWGQSKEAPLVWQGFLWQSRLTPELWRLIKSDFLCAMTNHEQLGKSKEQMCSVFGYICAHEPFWISAAEAREALRSIDAKGRAAVGSFLFRLLEAAGQKASTLWRNRLGPWVNECWPKDRALVAPESAFSLALMAVASGDAFPEAVSLVSPFLAPTPDYSIVTWKLNETSHPTDHPEEALALLSAIVDVQVRWPDHTIREVLDKIERGQPGLAADPRFRRIREYTRA